MSKNKSNIRSFEDLKVWRCARNLQRKISKLVKLFPQKEQFRLTDQMVRSSRSIARNIAEGYGRYHYQENIQFCRQARGSLTELLNDLITAKEEEYIDRQKFDTVRKDLENCHRLLNGYIAYLKKAKKNNKTSEAEIFFNVTPDNQ